MRKAVALIAGALLLAACGQSPEIISEPVPSGPPALKVNPLEDRFQAAEEVSRSLDRTNVPKNGDQLVQKLLDHRYEMKLERKADRKAERVAIRQEERERQQQADEPVYQAPQPVSGAGYTGIAVSIANCESGGNPQAYNASGASGLYQFMPETWSSVSGLSPPASAYSVEVQTSAFWELWAGGAGAHNWEESRFCWG